MTLVERILTIAVVVAATMCTRFLPFLFFPENKKTPRFIQYLGNVLPTAALGMLVIFAYKSVDVFQWTQLAPQIIASAVVIALHVWKRSMLLSIAAGTVCYMVLVQNFFSAG